MDAVAIALVAVLGFVGYKLLHKPPERAAAEEVAAEPAIQELTQIDMTGKAISQAAVDALRSGDLIGAAIAGIATVIYRFEHPMSERMMDWAVAINSVWLKLPDEWFTGMSLAKAGATVEPYLPPPYEHKSYTIEEFWFHIQKGDHPLYQLPWAKRIRADWEARVVPLQAQRIAVITKSGEVRLTTPRLEARIAEARETREPLGIVPIKV